VGDVKTVTFSKRILILVGMLVFCVAGLMFIAPIPQDPDYHFFADTRPFLGLANFGDVTSNLGFAVVGLLGLMTIFERKGRETFTHPKDSLPYTVFFIGVLLVSAGSAYYHENPNNDRLLWDRLPMTVGFMSLFAAFIADRTHRRTGITYLLPILIALGILSLVYWQWTESQGQGDLRFYGLVQFYPMVAIPVMCWLFPQSRYTSGKYLAWIISWYGAAKIFEHFDAEVFEFLGNTISGHSLKHLLSAVATFMVLRMLVQTEKKEALTR